MKFLEIVRYLPVLGSLWRRHCRQRNLDNFFLQLPLDVIFMIAEFLDPVDLVLFSQTCDSLRVLFQKHSNATRLSRTEYLSYLTGRARGKPRKWVCEKCMMLHPIFGFDTPAAINQVSTCPRRRGTRYTRTYYDKKRRDTRLQCGQIRIEHRHIQLALKYTRLQEGKYNSYLQALLSPHHDINFRCKNNAQLETYYSAYPKVVMGHDGNLRFLLLSTWRYHKGRGNISLDSIGYLSICPHVALDSRLPWLFHYPGYALQDVVNRALAVEGEEQTGACPRCATDFSVQLSCQFLDLHVWQDFGPEGSPVDLAWKTQCEDVGLDGVTNCWHWGPTLYHEPGTIRKLYGESGNKVAVKPRDKSPVVINDPSPLTDPFGLLFFLTTFL
ncbi:hypothetical protein F4824DRAFT_515854 [Ustulina deusta]|nr:hypothetical protein F4824DRAFT_515854 [Ustulina deusta]